MVSFPVHTHCQQYSLTPLAVDQSRTVAYYCIKLDQMPSRLEMKSFGMSMRFWSHRNFQNFVVLAHGDSCSTHGSSSDRIHSRNYFKSTLGVNHQTNRRWRGVRGTLCSSRSPAARRFFERQERVVSLSLFEVKRPFVHKCPCSNVVCHHVLPYRRHIS